MASTPHHKARSATIDLPRPRQDVRAPRIHRPSTAGTPEHAPILPLVGELGEVVDIMDSTLKAFLNQPQPPIPEPTIAVPIIQFDPVSPVVPLTQHQIPPTSHPETDIELSERSGSSSGNFESNPLYDTEKIVNYGPDGRVKSGTLRGLIERLILKTGDYGADRAFKETFLISYRAFTTADEVLRLLLEQFEAVSSPLHTTAQRAGVRYSVITILELWLSENYVEAKDILLLQRMREFAISVQASPSMPGFFRESADKLIASIETNLAIFLSPVPPLTPSSSSSSLRRPHTPADLTPRACASILTLIEGGRFRKITEADCIDWLEGINDTNRVSSFIRDNRKIGYWAQRSILRPTNQSERAENLKYFLNIVMECKKFRNFSSACAIANGLGTRSIMDLQRTYHGLDPKSLELFETMQKLTCLDGNFKAYRAALSGVEGHCIPWLYIHLHDLKMVHRAYPILVDEGDRTNLINFERCCRVHRRIRQLLNYKIPVIKSEERTGLAQALTLVESQLKTVMVSDGLHNWLQDRGLELVDEEEADYKSHIQELFSAGFLPVSTPAPSLNRLQSSSMASRQTSSFNHSISERPPPVAPTTPSQVSVSPTYPSAPRNIFPMDVFDQNSERCLNGRITRLSPHPAASGGYADVWEGLMGSQKVAIKTLRPWRPGGRLEESKLLKRLRREYSAWTWVSHPIVLECLGFCYDFSPEPYMLPSLISPWMSNGTLPVYLENNPETDRLKILIDVAEGLTFLHDQHPSIIHGDLRGGNILITDSGRPCLSDFGLSKVLKLEGMTSTTSEVAGSVRWMSPELLRDDVVASASSDVWAFSMTVLEVMSGRLPYDDVKNQGTVVITISRGHTPLRPQDPKVLAILTDEVWAVCQKCWNIVPRQRPSMRDVFSELRSISTICE